MATLPRHDTYSRGMAACLGPVRAGRVGLGLCGDSLPDDMKYTALDAAVNQGVGNAKKWLAEANGDVQKFDALREAHYRSLAASNPEKYGQYLEGWLARLRREEPAPRVQSHDTMAENVDSLPPATRDAAAETAVVQFANDDHVNVEPVVEKSLEEQWGVKGTDENPLDGSIPQPGRALAEGHDERIAQVAEAANVKPPTAETDGPLTAEAKASMTSVLQEAKAVHEQVNGKYMDDPKLTPEQNTAAKEAFDAPLNAFLEEMKQHDEAIAAHDEFAKGIETAVQCGLTVGIG